VKVRYLFLCALIFVALKSCKKDTEVVPDNGTTTATTSTTSTTGYKPTPYYVKVPIGFAPVQSPINNPMTVEGVDLGRKLFYDKILSIDSSMSCGSCHNQTFGFTDNSQQFSKGVSGVAGTRNAMPLFNLAYVERYAQTEHKFFWDGGAKDLESQVIGPITNPIEMEESLPHVMLKLQRSATYPGLFKKAFGSDSITTIMLMQAIAQFERTIVSGNTRFDFGASALTPQEQRGMLVFNDQDKGDCFHCHNLSSAFMTVFDYRNNGHSNADIGLEKITGNPEDRGKFRSATLRNLVYTAPYMHDGRFNTLEEVVEFYNSGASRVEPADQNITKHADGLNLSVQEKADLVAFLKSMTDTTLIVNPDYRMP
jgi:cytochrome c peroxidase